MGIRERLGTVLKSYLRGGSGDVHWRSSSGGRSPEEADPDLDAAVEELEAFLKGEKEAPRREEAQKPPRGKVPKEVRDDFAALGLAPGVSAAECKAAYKKLLKARHPDRHAADSENLKRATEETARINAAYTRLEKWFKTLN